MMIALEETKIAELGRSLDGALLRPGDEGYDASRRVWNAMIDRRPALIVRAASASDVVRAVGFARAHGLLLSVKGGGHNVAGNAVCDGGLTIDLSPLAGIRVDPDKRTVRVEAGLTWATGDRETQAFGPALTRGAGLPTGRSRPYPRGPGGEIPPHEPAPRRRTP